MQEGVRDVPWRGRAVEGACMGCLAPLRDARLLIDGGGAVGFLPNMFRRSFSPRWIFSRVAPSTTALSIVARSAGGRASMLPKSGEACASAVFARSIRTHAPWPAKCVTVDADRSAAADGYVPSAGGDVSTAEGGPAFERPRRTPPRARGRTGCVKNASVWTRLFGGMHGNKTLSALHACVPHRNRPPTTPISRSTRKNCSDTRRVWILWGGRVRGSVRYSSRSHTKYPHKSYDLRRRTVSVIRPYNAAGGGQRDHFLPPKCQKQICDFSALMKLRFKNQNILIVYVV